MLLINKVPWNYTAATIIHELDNILENMPCKDNVLLITTQKMNQYDQTVLLQLFPLSSVTVFP